MENKVSQKYFLLRSCILMISIMAVGYMLAVAGIHMPLRTVQYATTFFLLFICSVLFVLTTSLRNKPIVTNTVWFMVLIALTTFFSYFNNGLETILNTEAKAIFWATSLITAYSIGYKTEKPIEKSLVVTAIVPILFFLFLLVDSYLRETEDRAMITSAYYLLCLLPFVFILKSKVYKYICIALASAAILLSAKRAGFLVLVAAYAAYLFFETMMNGKNGTKLLRYIVSIAALYIVLVYAIEYFDLRILDRINLLKEDMGSGRVEVYQGTWELIKGMDLLTQFFGRGFDRVYTDLGWGLSAHSDFLEVLYDYGIIGFVFYLNMYNLLIRYARRLVRARSEYAPAFISSIVIMLGLSAFSHLIIFNTYFIFLCFFFGLVIGHCDRNAIGEKKCKQ